MRLGEVKGTRFGVHPNTPLYLMLRHEWQQSPYADGRLVDWVDVNPSIKRPEFPSEQSVPFVPMEAVDEDAAGYHEQKRPFGEVTTGYTIFERGDVIWAKITPCMQNGKSAILSDLSGPIGFGSTEFHVLRPRKRDGDRAVSPRFLFELLSLPRLRLAATSTFSGSAGQQRVPEDFLENLPAVVPPDDVQLRIVNAIDAARAARRRKLEDAESLLGGLDAFVLNALGLTLPPQNDALRQCWGVRLAETVSERRLDPHRFAPRTRKLRKMIETGNFKTVPLGSLIGDPVSGDWGVAEDERETDTDYVKALVIRATEFDDTENLILDNDRVRFRYLERESFELRSLKAGDLVLEKSGGGPLQPVGRVAIIEPEHLKDRQLSFTNFVMRLRPTGDVLPVYLWAFLGLVNRCGLTESMQAQTHGIRNLKLDEYLRQPVPVPDDTTQKKISAEVSRRRAAARRLREEAAQLWDDAKRRFEEELLRPTPANGPHARGEE